MTKSEFSSKRSRRSKYAKITSEEGQIYVEDRELDPPLAINPNNIFKFSNYSTIPVCALIFKIRFIIPVSRLSNPVL